MRRAATMAAALLVLAGCDRLGLGGGGANDQAAADADAGRPAENAAGNDIAVADAGLTRSRSLAALGGGSGATGGKDPVAIQAGAGPAVPAELLLGSWSDDGNCKNAIELRPDGSFTASTGAQGNWALDGDVLTLSGPGGNAQLRIRSVDSARIVTVAADGTTGQSTRC